MLINITSNGSIHTCYNHIYTHHVNTYNICKHSIRPVYMHKQTQHVSAIKCTRYSKDYTSMSNLHNKTMQHYFCKHIQNENDSKQFASISNITKQCKIICYNSNKTKTMSNNSKQHSQNS